MADEIARAAGPGTLSPGDLVATQRGLLRVVRVATKDASVPTGVPLSYLARPVGAAPVPEELTIVEADVEVVYRPVWRRP